MANLRRSVSTLTCVSCGTLWNGARFPTCPQCWYTTQVSSPNLITQKHDPNFLHQPWEKQRTVLPFEFVNDPGPYVQLIAWHGTAYERPYRGGQFVVVGVPSGSAAGSAVASGATVPFTANDSLLVAKPFQADAHAYAVNAADIYMGVSLGNYTPLGRCTVAGCDNQRLPPNSVCAKHVASPLAR